MSHQCFNFEELQEMLQKILQGELGVADGDERRDLIDFHLSGKKGPLACERIIDVLDKIYPNITAEKTIAEKMQRWLTTRGLHLAKTIKSKLPGSHNRPEFQRHRYPGISHEKLRSKLSQFQELLGNSFQLKIEQISPVMFKITI